jgi:hypothetical protein
MMTLPPRLGSLKSGTVKYGRESHGTPPGIVNNRHILSLERVAPCQESCNCLTVMKIRS